MTRHNKKEGRNEDYYRKSGHGRGDINTTSRGQGRIEKKYKADNVRTGGEGATASHYASGHGEKYQYRRNHPARYTRRNNDFIFRSDWHRILIIGGASLSQKVVLSSLLDSCKVPFIPVAYSCWGKNSIFFVNDRAAAEALADCNRKRIMLGSHVLKLKIMPGQPRTANFDTHCERKIKEELERRYDRKSGLLELSNFHMSKELVTSHFLPLWRKGVADKIFGMLKGQLSSVIAIDLSNNKLCSVEGFQALLNHAPSLKILNLARNKFQNMHNLDYLRGLQISELMLKDNPLCINYSDKDEYISDVIKRFPSVVKLDGVNVRGSFLDANDIIVGFWKQYVSAYDSDDRQQLIQFYHDTATMSMIMMASSGNVNKDDRSQIDPVIKLHQGKADIVASLQELPKATHDEKSFVINMPAPLGNFIVFNIVGILKEVFNGIDIREIHFSRTFAGFANKDGYKIVNELYFATAPHLGDQREQQSTQSTIEDVIMLPSEEEKKTILAAFSLQSGMNEEWSMKCLEENEWDFDLSATAFLESKKVGTIPKEAFLKP